MTHAEKLTFLLNYLLNENNELKSTSIPTEDTQKKRLLRSLMNIRPPKTISNEFLEVQDAYLQEELAQKGTISLSDLTLQSAATPPLSHQQHNQNLTRPQTGIYLWQGDITRLSVDAIVNAANNTFLGCFIPCHKCIDNAIHSAAGVQLRLECSNIMKTAHPKQKKLNHFDFPGKKHPMKEKLLMEEKHPIKEKLLMGEKHPVKEKLPIGEKHPLEGNNFTEELPPIEKEYYTEELTGKAIITKAYNLPCRYILHTVGPIIYGNVTRQDCKLLSDCYRSCLELAAAYQLKSIAFCCISTGEFHFPNEKAAEIAIQTVCDYQKKEQNDLEVVFNVFKDKDFEIYKKLLFE